MCLLQSSHTSSTAFFYFCMNTDTPIFAPYFENSPTHGFLHGKSLWKAAFTAGQYTDVSESTYLNEPEEVWKAREARRLWGSDSSSCLSGSVEVALYFSCTKTEKLLQETYHCYSPHGDWQNQSPGAEEPASVEGPSPAVQGWEDTTPQASPSVLSMRFACFKWDF